MRRSVRSSSVLILMGLVGASVAIAQTESMPAKPTAIAAAAEAAAAPAATKAAVGQQNLKIVYGSPAWNQDSAKPDSAFLFMRDKASGKIAKILLDETEPDSSIFSGSFAISFGQGGTADPQIYIPPRTLRNSDDAIKKFNQLLATDQIQPKPLIVKTEDSGLRLVDVYDTKEQVAKAQQAYAAEQTAKEPVEKKQLTKPLPNEQELETAKQAEYQKQLKALALAAAKQESERVRLEQIERQKVLERDRLNQALSEKQRREQKAKAAEFTVQANEQYQAGDYVKAEDLYKKALELDPQDKSNYFRYGVSLYRNQKYNDALVILKVTPDDPASAVEKKYYMGLIHMRLKEYDAALNMMQEVGKNKEHELAASGAFYEGVIYFSKEDYDKAKEPFERVIDISNDARLDEQAEEYLDKLASLIREKKMMLRRWFFNGMIGTMYDSNVLYSPDNETSQGASTDVKDVRMHAYGDAEYRPLYTKTDEAGIKASTYYMYSIKDEASYADPFLINIAIPYSHKGTLWGKGSKFGFKPAYEMIYMDVNKDSDRESIMSSVVLIMDNTFIMRNNWFANYSLEFRNDDIQTTDSTGDNNADAVKTSLKTAHTFLLDKSMKEGIVGSAGYVMNQAKGDEKYYTRYEVGVSYMRPTNWDSTWNVGLAYYLLDYSKSSDSREDKNITVSGGLTKPVKDWFSWNVNGSYTNNASSVSANQYSRYMIGASAIFNYSM